MLAFIDRLSLLLRTKIIELVYQRPWVLSRAASVDRVAVKFGTEVAEKWAARIVPLVSAGAGGALNYYFVRAWGRRAQKHFLARHREIASRRALWAHSATVREFSQRGIDPHAVPLKKPRSFPLLDPA